MPSRAGGGKGIRTLMLVQLRILNPPCLPFHHAPTWLGMQGSNLRVRESKPRAVTNLANPH